MPGLGPSSVAIPKLAGYDVTFCEGPLLLILTCVRTHACFESLKRLTFSKLCRERAFTLCKSLGAEWPCERV